MDQAVEQFCSKYTAHRIATPQHQPKPALGMTPNDCVDNAADYATLYPDWQFCAGWYLDGHRLLAHSWNRKRKKHRDVTPLRLGITQPQVYVLSAHWSERLWHALQLLKAGDTTQVGFIHPCYQYQAGEWREIANPVNDEFLERVRSVKQLLHKLAV